MHQDTILNQPDPDREPIIAPFGLNDAARELEQGTLPHLYLDEKDFNAKAFSPLVSIVVGRRGAGKTALAWRLTRPDHRGYDICVSIDEPAIFSNVATELTAAFQSKGSLNIVDEVAKVWELALWTSLMCHVTTCSDFDRFDGGTPIRRFLEDTGNATPSKASLIVSSVLESVAKIAKVDNLVTLLLQIDNILNSATFDDAKQALRTFLSSFKKSAVIVIDTMDVYEVRKPAMQTAIASMLQAVTRLSKGGLARKVEIKCFLPAELVPYLEDSTIANIGKTLEFAVYMHWRPRSLAPMLCRRLHHYLSENSPASLDVLQSIDWTTYDVVKTRMWNVFFSPCVTNTATGTPEDSLTYVMRHTQLQPRHLITIGNRIAQLAHEDRLFPHPTTQHVVTGVRRAETLLANEVLGSYRTVYPNCSTIISAVLNRQPNVFTGAYLDEIAYRSKSLWDPPHFPYDRSMLRQMLAELGIVGRVETQTDRYIKAQFEYNLEGRLVFDETDHLALHPMFYQRFQIRPTAPKPILPLGALPDDDD